VSCARTAARARRVAHDTDEEAFITSEDVRPVRRASGSMTLKLAPEITVKDLAARLQSEECVCLARCSRTVGSAKRPHPRSSTDRRAHGSLGTTGLSAMPTEPNQRMQKSLILCHHGSRSLQVLPVGWPPRAGTRVFSVAGGMMHTPAKFDPSVGSY